MEDNNVLVSYATSPDIMPAIKKAVAIVTDLGGIICHAAIVSRELHIPCVVGTKIATKVLQDGDIVEVDATHGIIRIINLIFMKPKIKLIIFDAAGVVWDGGYPVTCSYLAKKYNLPLEEVTSIAYEKWFMRACTGKISSLKAWQNSANELGLSLTAVQLEKLHIGFHKVRQSILKLSDDLRAQGYKTIILSNNFSSYVNQFKKKFGLSKHFDEILNSQELGMSKDDPRLFQYVMKKYNVTPEQTVYFDDMEKGLLVPDKMGIHTIHFKKEQQLKKDLEKLLTPIKLVVLDFHGVMVKGDYKPVCRMLAKKHKVKWQDVYKVLYGQYFNQAVMGKISESKVYLNTFRDFGWKNENWQQAHSFHKNAMSLNKNVFNFSKQLQDSGYQILLLSKNTRDQFNSYVKKFGLKKYFSRIVNTIDLNLPKASKETVEWIEKEFKVKANGVIFCDDQAINLVEPNKAGMKTILYKNFNQFKKELIKFL
ncbi:MAG: HAD-IA family hydrolase, partial [Candidatus Magasanikiibacteriota bacterium]